MASDTLIEGIPRRKNGLYNLNSIETVFRVPDYKLLEEKRKLATVRGAQFGFVFGQLTVLADKGQTFADLIRNKKGIFTVLMFKGALTGALVGTVYSYTATELAKARGKVDDGWNHVGAGMAGYLPFAFAYSKPIWQTVHGALICGALGGIFKLASQTDTVHASYVRPAKNRTQKEWFSEIFMEKEATKARLRLKHAAEE